MNDAKYNMTQKLKDFFLIQKIRIANFIKEHKYISAFIGIFLFSCIVALIVYASDNDEYKGKVEVSAASVTSKSSSSTSEIIRLMTTILGGVSVFVSFILGFLIIYASRFLIKRRNKEFGIYLTLGMSKRKISLILFFETLIIGVISLGVGLALGIVLSQLMSILVANMFEADLTKFQFTFSSSAALKTLLYFSIMYLIVMIFNTIIVNKCKLIDLLHGNKKSEKVKLKNPKYHPENKGEKLC